MMTITYSLSNTVDSLLSEPLATESMQFGEVKFVTVSMEWAVTSV